MKQHEDNPKLWTNHDGHTFIEVPARIWDMTSPHYRELLIGPRGFIRFVVREDSPTV